MTTQRITFSEEEGRRQQEADYDPATPLTEDVEADRHEQVGNQILFYVGIDDDREVLVHSCGADSVVSIDQIDGEEGEPAQTVPAEPGVAAPSPAGEPEAKRSRWGKRD